MLSDIVFPCDLCYNSIPLLACDDILRYKALNKLPIPIKSTSLSATYITS